MTKLLVLEKETKQRQTVGSFVMEAEKGTNFWGLETKKKPKLLGLDGISDTIGS